MFYGFIIVCGMIAGVPCVTTSFADKPAEGTGFATKEECEKTLGEFNKSVMDNEKPDKISEAPRYLNYGCFEYPSPVTDIPAFQMYIFNHFGPNVKREGA